MLAHFVYFSIESRYCIVSWRSTTVYWSRLFPGKWAKITPSHSIPMPHPIHFPCRIPFNAHATSHSIPMPHPIQFPCHISFNAHVTSHSISMSHPIQFPCNIPFNAHATSISYELISKQKWILQAQKQRTRAMVFLEKIFKKVDCIITPGMAVVTGNLLEIRKLHCLWHKLSL